MNISVVCILINVVVLVNCQGNKSVFMAIENYLTSSGAELRTRCIKESGVPVEVLIEAEQNAQVPESREFKCYLKCTFQDSNLIDENGVMNIDILKSLLKATSPAFIDKIEKNCKLPMNDDLCESAYLSCVCFLKTIHEEHIQA